MKKVTNAVVSVFLGKGFWETGSLRRYFEDPQDHEKYVPIYFRSTNCDFDPEINCYRFELPALHNPAIVEEVFIPREYIVGITVSKEPVSKEEMRRVGFALPAASA